LSPAGKVKMQDFIAIMIVALAAAFLARRGWQRFASRRASTCGSCANCSANEIMKPKTLVTLSPDFRDTAAASTRSGKEF
jgi:nitrate/TMAO reductase-like tetraheme cytochrome c subunit